MTFRIIDGGSPETPAVKKKQLADKVEQLKIFVSHMRSLEKSIASIKSMSQQIEWDELDKRLTSCHDQILDTLSFVKKSSNDKKQEKLNSDKPINTKLRLISLKDKE